jgi:hypothetical protein
MNNIFNYLSKITLLIFLCASNIALAQSDSTNLPGLSANMQTTPVTSSGTGVPNPAALDAVTTYTETEVEPCPSGYYANGPVPTDGTDVADETVTGGVIYDQTVTTDRYGTTTYGGWTEVNFLCTQIPPAPTCPTGEVEVSAPYWDSTTNQWVGIVCQNPSPAAMAQQYCEQTWSTIPASNGTTMQSYYGAVNFSAPISTTTINYANGFIGYEVNALPANNVGGTVEAQCIYFPNREGLANPNPDPTFGNPNALTIEMMKYQSGFWGLLVDSWSYSYNIDNSGNLSLWQAEFVK